MRALFCPLASHGFVFPAIAVARSLRELGHTGAFVTGPAFGPILEGIEIERVPRGKNDGQSFQVESWFEPLSVAMQVKHIEYALGAFAPDVLVAHPLSLGALLVAERARLPVAVLGLSAHLWPVREELGHPPPPTETEERLAWRHADMMRYYNEARRLFKLGPCEAGPRRSPFLGDLFMLQSVPELTPDIGDYPDRVHLVGACQWEPPPDAELEAWLAGAGSAGDPLIYVHHGRAFTSPSFWDEVTEALSDRPCRVAAAIGRMDRKATGFPSNFFVRGHLCQGAVLSRARMVVSGGNTTVVLGALTHGLPGLIAPGGGEQADVALQVGGAGAARVLDLQRLTPRLVREAVEEVLADEAMAARARELRWAFERAGGPRRAARLIERLAETRSPVLRGADMAHGAPVDRRA